MKRFSLSILILVSWLAGTAVAEEVRGLYEAEIPVADQQSEARQQAMRSGLAEVLVRITGSSLAPQESALSDLLANAARYVQQYRYRAIAATAATPAGVTLWMSFDGTSINQALRARGQPVWGSARPLLLVWLAVDSGGDRRLVPAADADSWPALEAAARRRGVPLRLPLLDLEDQTRLTAADVWGDAQQAVWAASTRYHPQAVLSGRLYADRSGGWHAQWTLQSGGEISRWESNGSSLDAVVEAGVNGGADVLAMRFAHVVEQGDGAVVTLHVADVHDLNGYARLVSYLDGLSGVTAVQITAVEPSSVTCSLAIQVPLSAVARTIGLGNTLAVVNGAAAGSEAPQVALHYRLLP